ncbi:DNAJ1 [Symbiodinium sp. CCMP2592]|nr:DNAJ1 [Symbiodinium sp. CCMP2592]
MLLMNIWSLNPSVVGLLGIDRNADEAPINEEGLQEAMKHHPVRRGDEAQFKDISKAYEVVSDLQKCQIYDAYGEEGLKKVLVQMQERDSTNYPQLGFVCGIERQTPDDETGQPDQFTKAGSTNS